MNGLPAKPEWTVRRRIVIAVLAWCCLTATYIIVLGKNDALRQQALVAVVSLASSVTLGYVFGAAWDDRNYLNAACKHIRPPRLPDGPAPGPAAGEPCAADGDPPPEPEGDPDGAR